MGILLLLEELLGKTFCVSRRASDCEPLIDDSLPGAEEGLLMLYLNYCHEDGTPVSDH